MLHDTLKSMRLLYAYATREGNKSIEELKRGTAVKELDKLTIQKIK